MGARFTRFRQRATWLAGTAFVVGLLALAVGGPASYVVVHQTAKPEFCISCHIMDPYYESWQNSSHKDVSCIECHYEPGAVETFVGKFKALSQVAKYFTQTQGTKPWAEVSDVSCMRGGCHSARELEGEVQFGNVAFDHRHHMLESRRGRRLRCVSCHSQIVQGEHVSVTSSVCFMCHFMPESDGSLPEASGDCMTCHGPPADQIMVAGRPFEHAEYVQRGVDCQECHDPVVEGVGTVRKERCHSCHAEVGHIERFGDSVFMHETHVTSHKVECFECHDDIHHGLLPLRTHEPAASEGCGACHQDSHGAVGQLLAGTGAIGTEPRPSRMFETRVVCEACHSGRSGLGDVSPHPAISKPGSHHAGFASAGNVDCIHCHGTGFDGMLDAWQTAVSEQLARVRPQLEELEQRLPESGQEAARALLDEAAHNVELVALDGSRGAHNVDYALAALEAGAARIDAARGLLGLESAAPAAAGFPFRSEHGCSTCHLGAERLEVAALGEESFPHGPHLLAAALDCDACHALEPHGAPAPARQDCNACHHAERPELDVSDCAACHAVQGQMLAGALPGFASRPGPMSEMECGECHGEAPDVLVPGPQLCVVCHEQGYDRMQLQWQQAVTEQLERLEPLLGGLSGSAAEEAGRGLALVRRDGSLGVHNPTAALAALRESAAAIERGLAERDPAAATRAAGGFPYESPSGCSTCHLGAEELEAFPHRAHVVQAGLDCAACHSVEEHGAPSFDRASCADCHHQESESFDAYDCASCHAPQERFVAGELAGFEPLPGVMLDKGCSDCHGEPPTVAAPNPQLCVLCHEPGYDELPAQWEQAVTALSTELEQALAAAAEGGDPDALQGAQAALAGVRQDGSAGAHNFEFARRLLQDALDALRGE